MIIEPTIRPDQQDRIEEFFARPDLTQAEADREALGWIRQHRQASTMELPGFSKLIPGAREKLAEIPGNALGQYKSWIERNGLQPLGKKAEALQLERVRNISKNLDRWSRLYSDETFEEALGEYSSETLEAYQEAVKATGDNPMLKQELRKKLFLNDLTGRSDNVTQGQTTKELFKTQNFSDEGFVQDAGKWISEGVHRRDSIKSAHDKAFNLMLEGADRFEVMGTYEEIREDNPEAGDVYLKTVTRFHENYRKIWPIADRLVQAAKAEGERGLFEQKSDINYPKEGTIARIYAQPKGRERFLRILNALIEKEGEDVDLSGITKFAKSIARGGETVSENLGMAFMRADKFGEEGRRSDEENEYWNNVQQVTRDLRNVKEQVARIESDSNLIQGFYDAGQSIPYFMMMANPAGMATAFLSTQEDMVNQILDQNPDLDESKAQMVAIPAALAYLGVERVSFNTVKGAFPGLKKAVFQKAVPEFLRRAALVQGAEYTQETIQDMMLPVFQDVANSFEREIPKGDWEQFEVWDKRRFFAVLPFAVLGAGGQTANHLYTLDAKREMSQDVQGMVESGLPKEDAEAVAELGKENPQAAMELFQEKWNAIPEETRRENGQKAYEERIKKAYEASPQSDNDLPLVIPEKDGYTIRMPDGRMEKVASRDEAFLVVKDWFTDESGNTIESFQNLVQYFKNRAEGDNIVEERELRTLQEVFEAGEISKRQMKKAVKVFHAQEGTPLPKEINYENYYESGSVNLRRDMKGYIVRLATDKATPDTVIEEFAEGFMHLMNARGEATYQDVKLLLDELGEAIGQDLTPGYEVDPARAVTEGFSQFVKAYAMQDAVSDQLPEATKAWFGKAKDYMSNRENLSPKLKALADFFLSLLETVFRLAKALEAEIASGRGINADLENLAQRALGIDPDAIAREAQRKADEEIKEELGFTDGPTMQIKEGDIPKSIKPKEGEEVEISEPAPGTAVPVEVDVDTLEADKEGEDIKWDEKTFSVAPKNLPETFPFLDQEIVDEITKSTDKIAVIQIDRMKVGEYKGTPLQGGMFYPTIVENLKSRVVWAFNSKGAARDIIRRTRKTGGYAHLVLMEEGNITGNKTFSKIWFDEVEEAISEKRLTKTKALKHLNEVRSRYAEKTGHTKAWKTIEEARQEITNMPQMKRSTYYMARSKANTKARGVHVRYGNLLSKTATKDGFPDAEELVGNLEEPSFKGMDATTIVGIIKIDEKPDTEDIQTGEEAGVTEHFSYKYVLHGEPVARMKKRHTLDELRPDTKNKLMSQAQIKLPLNELTFGLRTKEQQESLDEAIDRLFAGGRETIEAGQKLRRKLKDIKNRFEAKTATATDADSLDEAQLNAIIQLNAIASVLPREIRYTVGSPLPLVQKKTDKGRNSEIIRRLEKTSKALNDHVRGKLIEKIDKILEDNKIKKKGTEKIPTGKLGPDAHTELDKIREVIEMTDEEVGKAAIDLEIDMREADLIEDSKERDDKILEVDINFGRVSAFGKLKSKEDPMSVEGTETALAILEELVKTNKIAYQNKLLIEKERRQELKRKTLEVVTGGKGRKTSRERLIQEEDDDKKSYLKQEHARNISFEMMLNALSRKDVDSASMESFLNRHFGEAVHIATHKEKIAVNQKKIEFFKFIADIYGIDTEKRGWQSKIEDKLAELGKRVESSGIFREEHSGVKTYRSYRAEAESIVRGEFDHVHDGYGWVKLTKEEIADLDKQLKEDKNAKTKDGRAKPPKENFDIVRNVEGRIAEQYLSQDSAMFLTMMYAQEGLRPAMEYHGYTPELMEQMELFLTPEAKAIRFWLFRKYDKNYDYFNETFSKMFGVNLAKVDNYSPAKSIHSGKQVKEMIDTGSGPKSTTPGMAIERIKHKAEPRYDVGALSTYMDHVEQTEHFVHWAPLVKDLRSVFLDKEVREAIIDHHGREIYEVLTDRIDVLANGGRITKDVNKFLDHLRQTFTVAKLAFKWGIFLKQLTSIPAYAFDIPVKDFLKYEKDFFKNPVKNWKKMWDLEYVQQRFDEGYDRDVMLVLGNLSKKKKSKLARGAEWGMISGRAGDIIPVVVGGYAAYRYHKQKALDEGLSPEQAEARGVLQFEMATDRAQQSGNLKDQSFYALGGSLFRVFTMFQTSPRQYYANMAEAIGDMRAGRKGGKQKAAKAAVIAHVVLPSMFYWVSAGVRNLPRDEDDQDELGELLSGWGMSMALGPLSGLFIWGQAINTVLSGWEYGLPILEWANEAKDAKNRLHKMWGDAMDEDEAKNIDPDDVIDFLDNLATTGSLTVGGGALWYDIGKNFSSSVGFSKDDFKDMLRSEDEVIYDELKEWKKDFYEEDRESYRDAKGSLKRAIDKKREAGIIEKLQAMESQSSPESFDKALQTIKEKEFIARSILKKLYPDLYRE